ncbi:LamG-like jellyroll fold domain-containing protein [Planctomycetota bacterium]
MCGSDKPKNSLLITLLSLAIISLFGLPVYADYSGGTGEPNDPYQIATAADLILLGETPEDYDKHFIMTADIDLDPNLPGRKVFDTAVVSDFTGVFDGNYHTISHLTIRGGSNVGLFGQTGPGARISNLALEAVDVSGSGTSIGGLVGYNNEGNITSCYSTGSVLGVFSVGGLVGDNNYGSITASYGTGLADGWSDIGGLVGWNEHGIITTCYSTGSVRGMGSIGYIYDGACNAGGLVGYNNEGNIMSCYSTGSVTRGDGSGSSGGGLGGLVGFNGGIITTSYSTSCSVSVSGEENVGGLVGFNSSPWWSNPETKITDSYWDIETSNEPNMCGYHDPNAVGCNNSYGLTTAEMQTTSTFLNAGWDFIGETANGPNDVWKIIEGQTYPLLSWQKYGGGTGEPNDPYLIYTAEHLNELGAEPNDYDKHFKLMADIDLSAYLYSSAVIAPDANEVGWRFDGTPFNGVFDGNKHVISHLTINEGSYLALFGQLDSEAEVSNLGLEAVDVNGSTRIASLAARNYGYITGSYSTGIVRGGDRVGGLVGVNGPIGNIVTSYSTVAVEGSGDTGGLVGRNYGSITRSYSKGLVKGENLIGGLVGSGRENSSAISSFWDIETSGQGTSSGGTGLTTAEMQTASTFLDAGWDFINESDNGTEDIWWINEGKDSPRLWWEQATIMPLAHLSLDVNDIIRIKRGRGYNEIVALDVTGNGNDGVLEGDIAWVDDPVFGTVLAFDGVNDRIVIADGDFIDFTQPFSVAFWIKTDTNDIDNVILSKGNGDGSWQRGEKMIEIVSPNSWANMWRDVPVGAIEFEGNWIGGVGGSTDVTNGVWHHVVVTWNGEISGAIYVDGLLETLTFNSYDGSLADNVGDAIFIGARDDDMTFTGSIVDIRLYDVALTEAQVNVIKAE